MSEYLQVFGHVGFFLVVRSPPAGTKLMCESSPTLAQQVARAASAFQQQSTGHVPGLVTVVLSEDTLVVTLHEALTPAEKALAQRPADAAQLREFHLQLFADSCGSLRQEIEKITGVEVREATSQVETTTGTMVQVFLLADAVSPEIWNGMQEQGSEEND